MNAKTDLMHLSAINFSFKKNLDLGLMLNAEIVFSLIRYKYRLHDGFFLKLMYYRDN